MIFKGKKVKEGLDPLIKSDSEQVYEPNSQVGANERWIVSLCLKSPHTRVFL